MGAHPYETASLPREGIAWRRHEPQPLHMDMHFSIELDAPASAAWRVLGEDFGDIAGWTSSLLSSGLDRERPEVGAVRTCASPGWGPFPAGEVTEELTRFERDAMTFTYAATSGLPPFVRAAQNRWTVEPTGPERCVVHSHATLELAWWAWPMVPFVRLSTRGPLRELTEELRHRVERGCAHPRVAVAST